MEQRRKFNIDLEQSKTKSRNVAHQKQRRGEIVNVEQYVSQRAEKFMVDNASKYNLFYEKRKLRWYIMPVHKVKGGWKYGTIGKVYKSKAKAERQGRAIKASQNRRKPKWML